MWSSRPGQPPIFALNADLFRVLGHPARVRVLQLLRGGELSVGAIQHALDLDSSGVSQHLTALRKQGLVVGRREGTSVYYRVKDARTLRLLELSNEIILERLEENQALLDDLVVESAEPRRVRKYRAPHL
ncbi:MAG: metalloregulator ArsR/SmtB family transcription factor [Solirubrobacteraceae bacterium]|jgi:ArsR family transcriptional regulator